MSKYRGTPIKLIQFLYEQDKSKIYELNEYKKNRNKKQNDKYWKLLGELSLKLQKGIEELHKEMLKNYSQRYEILVPSNYSLRGIEYFDKKSMIDKNGKNYYVYHVYVPSHELNESEFAILMSGLIEECKLQDIETRSPEEILKDEQIINQ